MVTVNQAIIKMLIWMNLTFSRPQTQYIARFVHGIILAPGKRTVSNIHRVNLMDREASCYTRFLKESPWNEQLLQRKRVDWIHHYLLKRKKGDTRSVGFLNEKVISTCDRRGFFYIGGLKANAIIYPWGHRASITKLAHSLLPQDLHSVTVEGKRYDVFVYEGKVSKIDNAQVILSWEDGYDANEFPFALICTDVSLDPVTVLTYYGKRWAIETSYRYLKEHQGFDQYQIRSLKAIRRFWIWQCLTYTYLEIQRDHHQLSTLGEVLHRERQAYLGRLMMYAYEQGLRRIPAKQMLDEFGLTAYKISFDYLPLVCLFLGFI